MSEFSVLSEYLKGETFYYYYSPENKILDAIWGFGGHKMDGVPWTARRTKEEAEQDGAIYRLSLANAKESLARFHNEKQDWHPLKGVFEMVELIKEAMEIKDKIKPKSEFDILNEEQKKVFDSDLKVKIEKAIELKRKFYVNMKVRLASGGVSEYGNEIDLGRMSTCIAEIRTLEELLK